MRRDTDSAREFQRRGRESSARSFSRSRDRAREAGQRKRYPYVRKQTPVQLVCVVCEEPFTYIATTPFRRKTCSQKCANAIRRRANGDRAGKRNPNFRHGGRAGDRDRENESRWYAVLAERCAAPECDTPQGGTRGLALHHIVYRQHVRGAKGDEFDPRNALTLCDSCHISHHRRGRVIPIAMLPDAALEFGFELLGRAASPYFERYYHGTDERLSFLERTYSSSPEATPGEAESGARNRNEAA